MSVPRPHLKQCDSDIRNVAALPGGGYALVTGAGIEVLDASLATVGKLPHERPGEEIRALADGRFLLFGRISWLYEGRLGGELTQIGEDLCSSVAVTRAGFMCVMKDKILVDCNGERRYVDLPFKPHSGITAWRGGAAVAGYDGLAILDAEGHVVATSGEGGYEAPVALANGLAVRAYNDIAVFDGEARLVTRLPTEVMPDGITALADGLLARAGDDDTRRTELTYWSLRGGAAEAEWTFEADEVLLAPTVIDTKIVAASCRTAAWILDADGDDDTKLDLPGTIFDAAPFAGGIAMRVQECPDVLWWRPGAELERLSHDTSPRVIVAVPAGLATAEVNVFYLWRADGVEPEIEPRVESALPMGEPIVVGGQIVTIQAAGRVHLRGVTRSGRLISVAPDAEWRPATKRDEAVAIAERLIQGPHTDELSALPSGDYLAQLPLAQSAALHGRAIFRPGSLDRDLLKRVAWAREAFFEELGAALGVSGRVALAAIRARKLELKPPREVAGYEYLGAFTTGGALTISDPCYIGKKAPKGSALALSLDIAGHMGAWHIFARPDEREPDRIEELVTVHEAGLDVFATEAIGSIGVDSGTAGVFDKKCPVPDLNAPLEQGAVAGLGALVRSGFGDGMYPVFVGKAKGRIAKIRIFFMGDEPDVDRSAAATKGDAKPYSISMTFSVGDVIEHAKFGLGTVARAGDGGKIDVQFRDGIRTLIHGKK